MSSLKTPVPDLRRTLDAIGTLENLLEFALDDLGMVWGKVLILFMEGLRGLEEFRVRIREE